MSFALARLTPGTNLLAFCTAVGWLIRGAAGAVATSRLFFQVAKNAVDDDCVEAQEHQEPELRGPGGDVRGIASTWARID